MDPSSPIDLKPDVGDSLTSNPSSSTMETAVKTEPSTSQDADTSDEILDVEGDVKPSTSGESPIKSDNGNSKEEPKTESNQEERESGQEQSKSGSSSPEKRDRDEREEELQAHRNKKAKQDEERTKMQVLVSNFSEDQLNRYEMFRRAAFPKASIKRLMQNITGSTVSPNVVIAMSGIAKVYVGEIVETALDVMENWEERQGPIQPKHLREAVRRIKNQGGIPTTKYQKKLLR